MKHILNIWIIFNYFFLLELYFFLWMHKLLIIGFQKYQHQIIDAKNILYLFLVFLQNILYIVYLMNDYKYKTINTLY